MLAVPSPRKTVGKLLHRGDLDPNLVVYGAYWFKQYACNPRAIYEKAAELAPHLRGVWVIDEDHVAAIPEGSSTSWPALRRTRSWWPRRRTSSAT